MNWEATAWLANVAVEPRSVVVTENASTVGRSGKSGDGLEGRCVYRIAECGVDLFEQIGSTCRSGCRSQHDVLVSENCRQRRRVTLVADDRICVAYPVGDHSNPEL